MTSPEWSCGAVEEGPAGFIPSGWWSLGVGVLSVAFPPC